MICQILGVFRNTLTAIDKYPFRDLENFLSPTQLQLSLKRKTSSDFLNPLMESTSNFKDFEKKMVFIATLLRKLQALRDLLRLLSKKHCFRTPFDSQHVKESQTLVKSS